MKLANSFRILLLSLVLSSCAHRIMIQKDYQSTIAGIDTVSIVFPEIKYSVKNGKAIKVDVGYSIFVSRNVAEAIKEIVDSGKFISKAAVINIDTLEVNKWVRDQFSNSLIKYNQMKDSLQVSSDGQITLPSTPEFQFFVSQLPTRYFFYIAGVSYGVSEAIKQNDIQQEQTFKLLYDSPFIYNYHWYSLKLQIALVDKKSKEILWYNYNEENDSNYNPLEKKSVISLCQKILTMK